VLAQAALSDKLAGLTAAASTDWLERLDVTADCPLEQSPQEGTKESKIQDDFKREMAFYKQALAAVQVALPRLHDMQIVTERPDDYFAEMVKSDQHMKKVRETLLSKQKALERSEKARKLREIKKFGKKVQHEVLQKRQKEKKEALEAVKKYRKDHQQKPDFLKDGGDEFDVIATNANQVNDKQVSR
jgi:rRNA-processing protein EBP2